MHWPKCCSSSLNGLSCQLNSFRHGVRSASIPCNVTYDGSPREKPVGNDTRTRAREPFRDAGRISELERLGHERGLLGAPVGHRLARNVVEAMDLELGRVQIVVGVKRVDL